MRPGLTASRLARVPPDRRDQVHDIRSRGDQRGPEGAHEEVAPRRGGRVTGPGTAITTRESRSACPAVLSAPLRAAASTTTVPRPSAAMTRLRSRNRTRVGRHPGGSSDTTAPVARTERSNPSCAAG